MSNVIAIQNQDALTPSHLLRSIEVHLQGFDSLSAFAEVAKWDSIASEQAGKLSHVCSRLEQGIHALTAEFEAAKLAHSRQQFFRRIFTTSPAIEVQERIENLKAFADKAERLLDLLHAKIEFSPNDIASKKALLAELRQRKKELQLEKKQLSLTMQTIRSSARQQSANAPYSALGILGGRKVTALQRQAIRHAKEQAVAPHEQEKARIDWEMTQIDELVLWLERIR